MYSTNVTTILCVNFVQLCEETQKDLLIFTSPFIANIILISVITKKMPPFKIIYFQKALHASGGPSAHHREHINVHTVSGIVNQYCCWLVDST